jgi:hypothetical protein
MVAHPLRAKHYYEAHLDMDEFRDGDFTPGRGHVGRAGGGYYLAYRKVEFKNARSQVFQSLQDHDLVTFPLDDPEHPFVALEVEGRSYSLNEPLPRLPAPNPSPPGQALRPDRSPPAPVSGCRYEGQNHASIFARVPPTWPPCPVFLQRSCPLAPTPSATWWPRRS